MFLRATVRKKDSKEHCYWSGVENRRVARGRVMQRHGLYLAEINLSDESIGRLRLSQLWLCRPRQWGACWLALTLWQELKLDEFWAARLPPSRTRTRWGQVLFVLVAYRLIEPGSEWRLRVAVVVVMLQPRSSTGLRTDRPRAGGDAAGLAAGL